MRALGDVQVPQPLVERLDRDIADGRTKCRDDFATFGFAPPGTEVETTERKFDGIELLVPPAVLAVDDLCLCWMNRKSMSFEAFGYDAQQKRCLLERESVHDDVIAIAFETYPWMVISQSGVEHIMQENVG